MNGRALFLLAVALAPVDQSLAQGPYSYCEVEIKAWTSDRQITGAVNVECGAGLHSAPWGNWGVTSNFDRRRDTDQFRGWKHIDGPSTKRQWNSCTTRVAQFRAPNPNYYNNRPTYDEQYSSETVGYGRTSFRTSYTPCSQIPGQPTNPPGCSNLNGEKVTIRGNYMKLYELDAPDPDDFVTELSYPDKAATLTGCDQDGCPESTSSWSSQSSSSRAGTGVRADMRISVRARHRNNCRW